MMHVTNLAHVRVRLPSGVVDAEVATVHHMSTHAGEARRQLGEVGQGGACTRMLVVIESESAVVVEDRHERTRETTLGDGGSGTVLTVDGQLIEPGYLDVARQIAEMAKWPRLGA